MTNPHIQRVAAVIQDATENTPYWVAGKPETHQCPFENAANALDAQGLLVEPAQGTDPRPAAGSIAGPGGPHDRNAVVIDATNAVLFDGMNVAIIEAVKNGVKTGQAMWCMNLEGRINKTQDRSAVNYLFNPDGAAAIVSELMALASRQGAEVYDEFMERLSARMETLTKDGNL